MIHQLISGHILMNIDDDDCDSNADLNMYITSNSNKLKQ
jgi:hypothetical protein